jgi:putative transposase
MRQAWGTTKEQRCWVHKMANVLDKLPKGSQPKAKGRLHDIYQAEGREGAGNAFDLFVKTYEAKYPKATECLVKDRDVLLAFDEFPAKHWVHIRTTNPIESVFSTVRLRHDKTKGNGSRSACLTMVLKLMESASKGWRSLNGSPLLAEVVKGTVFIDGIKEKPAAWRISKHNSCKFPQKAPTTPVLDLNPGRGEIGRTHEATQARSTRGRAKSDHVESREIAVMTCEKSRF